MAMSVPIILGVEGEVKSIIDEAGTGVCIEPESAEQLADAVLSLKNNQELYRGISAKGPQYVAEHFDRKMLADQYLAVLEKLQL